MEKSIKAVSLRKKKKNLNTVKTKEKVKNTTRKEDTVEKNMNMGVKRRKLDTKKEINTKNLKQKKYVVNFLKLKEFHVF